MRSLLGLLLPLLAVLLAGTPPGGVGDGARWWTDLEAATTEAARSARPLLIVFR